MRASIGPVDQVPPTGDDSFHRALLKVREEEIVPRLAGAKSIEAAPIGDAAVTARWRLGDGTVLAMAANFDEQPCRLTPPGGQCLFSSRAGALDGEPGGGVEVLRGEDAVR